MAEQSPAFGWLNKKAPRLLCVGGVVLACLALLGLAAFGGDAMLLLLALAVTLFIFGCVAHRATNAVRDRVLAILALGVFLTFFWAAFEQASNPLNQWADKATNRYLTEDAPAAEFPEEPAAEVTPPEVYDTAGPVGPWQRFTTLFALKPDRDGGATVNPVPTAWFQSINPAFICVLGVPLAWLWTRLARKDAEPSTPLKMALGITLMSLSMVAMTLAARQEDRPSRQPLPSPLPEAVGVNGAYQVCEKTEEGLVPFQAGRLTWDASGMLVMTGVLSDVERDRIVGTTAPAPFAGQVQALKKQSGAGGVHAVTAVLPCEPPGFDPRYAGLRRKGSVWEGRALCYDHATRTITARGELSERDAQGLLVAAGDPAFRDAVGRLYAQSQAFRVSPWWLVLSYLLASLGELCLSPVGLSMVSRLAPRRFATMLMGLWMTTGFFGAFLAGTLGELWGTIPPMPFFLVSVVVLGLVALALFALVRPLTRLMHGVGVRTRPTPCGEAPEGPPHRLG
jgi:dipeptide/tripeptide permease